MIYSISVGGLIGLQEKLLDSQYSKQKPNDDFLQSFAGVVGDRWPSLASLLFLTAEDVEKIKRDKEKSSQANQALHMLRNGA